MMSQKSFSKVSPAWLMLASRSLLFLFFQALCAIILFLTGKSALWNDSSKWWPVCVFLANLVSLFFLDRLYKIEGLRFRDVFKVNRATIKSDLMTLLLVFPALGALGFFPNLLLGKWLFGESMIALEMYISPLPLWATFIAVAFLPVTQGLAELPAYFAYAMPRLETQTGRRWLAVFLAGFALSAQHIFAPLLLDYRFILWRALIFLPFAIATGILLRWRPRLMPYMAFIHILMDLSLAPFFLGANL